MKEIAYTFRYFETCIMCNANIETCKVLGKRLNQSQGFSPKNKIGVATTILRCQRCDTVWANPQPVPLNINQHYGVMPDKYWKQDYFSTIHHKGLDMFNALYTGDRGRKLKALDIGAGIGKTLVTLNKAGFDAIGVEPSQSFAAMALKKNKISPKQLIVARIEDVSFRDNTFDYISIEAVLEHVVDPSALLKKATKWLRPNGIIYIDVPSSLYLVGTIMYFYYRATGSNYVTNTSPMHKPYHLFEFAEKSFRENSRINNYSIVASHYYVGGTHAPKIVRSILDPIMKFTNTGMQLCVCLSKDTR